MEKKIFDSFYETFKLSERKGTGQQIFKYVPNEDVIDRMNRIFQGNWSTEILHTDVFEDQVLVRVKVSVKDPESKECFSHEGFGSHALTRYTTGPNTGKIIELSNGYKSALSKAIVSACTRWGVGLYKEHNPYDDDYVDNVEQTITTPLPQTDMTLPAGIVINKPIQPIVPNEISKPAKQEQVVIVAAPTPPSAPVVPAAPVVRPMTSARGTLPGIVTPIQSTHKIPVDPGFNNQKPQSASMPTHVSSPSPIVSTPPNVDLPFSGGEIDYIRDVQKAALSAILNIRKISYAELAAEAFANAGINKPVPDQDKLVYEDAVVVIKYGNDKYRNKR